MTDSMITVEVIPGTTPESLLVRPIRVDDRRRVYAVMNSVPHDRPIRLAAEGVVIDAFETESVLSACGGRLRQQLDVQAERILQNRRHVSQHHAALREQVQAIMQADRTIAEDYLPDYSDLQILDDHQCVNVACMTLPNGHGLCVFDEQGAGKTVTGIFAYDTLVQRDQCDVAPIVAPKSMVAEWPADFARFTEDRYAKQVTGGSRHAKRGVLATSGDVFVTNYETVVQLEEELSAFLPWAQSAGTNVKHDTGRSGRPKHRLIPVHSGEGLRSDLVKAVKLVQPHTESQEDTVWLALPGRYS